MTHRIFFLRLPTLLAGLSLVAIAPAAVVKVNSIATLQSAIDAAKAGDRIVVQDGAYTTTAPIKVACAGTTGAPVVIAAETVGGVEINGAQGFTIAAPAAYVTIEGFRFTHAAGHTSVAAGTSHVRLTRNSFQCVGEGAYLTVTGDDAEIDRNEFRDKRTLGNMIGVTGTGSQVARRLWIHHNYFHDFENAHGNGAETIRFGLSGLSMSTGGGLVEHNLFVRCNGENELISNKSSGNTYRYNAFLDSPGAQLTIRHGNDCVAYGNYFRNTDGLRIFGDRHAVIGNFFEGNTRGINLGNGDGEVADGAKLTSHDRPDYCTIAANTLLENKAHYQMDGRKDGMGATHTAFAFNIIQGGETAAKIDGPNVGAVWREITVTHTANAGGIPPEALKNAALHFTVDAGGAFLAQAGPVTSAVPSGSYPAPVLDAAKLSRKDGALVLSEIFPLRGMMIRIPGPGDVGPASR